ncbi:hypothetical protein L1887_35376 [Cichorium endivia]|nr:hypothetical protein L1887_35376 [Cichorium endivia]
MIGAYDKQDCALIKRIGKLEIYAGEGCPEKIKQDEIPVEEFLEGHPEHRCSSWINFEGLDVVGVDYVVMFDAFKFDNVLLLASPFS